MLNVKCICWCLSIIKPGQVFHRSGAGNFKMFLYGYALFVVSIFIYCRCKYVVSNKLYYFRGNHSGDSMLIRVKVYCWRISFNIQHTKSYFTQNLWYAYLLFCTVLRNIMAIQKREVRFRLTWGITGLIRHIITSNLMRSFDGELFWQIDLHTYRHTYRQTDTLTDRQTDTHTYRQTNTHTDRQTHIQTDRQTHIQTDRQTGTDTQTYRHNLSIECSLFWWNAC